MKSLPMYFPEKFDRAQAITCARLVGFAYDMYNAWLAQGKPRQRDLFRWQPPVVNGLVFSKPIWSNMKRWGFWDDSEPFGFTARTKEGIGYLVFRGTESASDWMQDVEAAQAAYPFVSGFGQVHAGFLGLYRSMRETVLYTLNELLPLKTLYVTGHSLGCGLSTLAVPDVSANPLFKQVYHYNFASPRVGDPQFAAACNASKVPTFRVVNTCDVVPQVPLPAAGRFLYNHVGLPVDFTAQYGSIAANHSSGDAYLYALEHPDQPAGPTAQ